MSEQDDLLKALSDFIKGKTGSSDVSMAKLSWDGSEPPHLPVFPNPSSTFREMAAEYPVVIKSLSRCALPQTIALIAGLLTLPDLQANGLRLEALAHLALMYSRGKQRPTAANMAAWFNNLNHGTCGELEDPSEDLFIGNVCDNFGNYRLFEGTGEANAFHTQIVINILETMPSSGDFGNLRKSIRSLLRLSDALAERCALPRNTLGAPSPRSTINKLNDRRFNELKWRAVFDLKDLSALDVSIDDLEPFIIEEGADDAIANSTFGHSPLEATPLFLYKNSIVVSLPNAIGLAVRRLVIETCIDQGLTESFERSLAEAYSTLFRNERVLGELSDVPAKLVRHGDVFVADICTQIDEGRYLDLFIFCDSLKDYENGGFIGCGPTQSLSKLLDKAVERSCKEFSETPGFREGLTLIVGCGWGRALELSVPQSHSNWRIEVISVHDLVTFGRKPNFEALDLLRVLDARDEVERLGISLIYANGLLNLYAWMMSNDGHIVPHEKLDGDFISDGHPSFLTISENSLLDVRAEVAQAADIHRAKYPTGTFVLVRRVNGASRYGSTALSPFYADIEAFKNREFVSVYRADDSDFWIKISTAPELKSGVKFHLAMMVLNWAECVARKISTSPELRMPKHSFWQVNFLDDKIPRYDEVMPDENSIDALIKIELDISIASSKITVGKGFLATCRRSDNKGERAIVRALVEASLAFNELPSSQEAIDQVVASVISDDGARHFHAFANLDVRDHVRDSLPAKGQIIERMDDANNRLGLGWLVRNRIEGEKIEGRDECCRYLNKLVKAVAERLIRRLNKLGRIETIKLLLLNHEALASESNHWQRTFRAVRALSIDRELMEQEATNQIARFNAASLASRIVIEIALCESPLIGGFKPGAYDLAELITDASQLFHLGGYSDAIANGVMPATIRISPAGDVLMDHGFTDRIVRPFGRKFQSTSLADAADHYEDNYTEMEDTIAAPDGSNSTTTVDEAFEAAWLDEFKVSLSDTKKFVAAFRTLAIRSGQAVLTMHSSELFGLLKETSGLDGPPLEKLMHAFTLSHRPKWDTAPKGMLPTAWHPWRFRRQLSIVMRPIIRLEDKASSTYLIAPAMIVHHISKFVSDTLFGRLDVAIFRSEGKLASWIGAANRKQGEAFNERAAKRLQELGWNARANLSDGEILDRPKDQAFGDVDVLAWSSSTGRVLIIECKDLSLDKTLGEIARRLAKYRGSMSPDGRNRDELRRHLDRYDQIHSQRDALAKYTNCAVTSIEPILLFSRPAPMQFDDVVKAMGVKTVAFDDLADFISIS